MKSTARKRRAFSQGVAALAVTIVVMTPRAATNSPGDIFSIHAPTIGADTPKIADLKTGDPAVSTQTGALEYSYAIVTGANRISKIRVYAQIPGGAAVPPVPPVNIPPTDQDPFRTPGLPIDPDLDISDGVPDTVIDDYNDQTDKISGRTARCRRTPCATARRGAAVGEGCRG